MICHLPAYAGKIHFSARKRDVIRQTTIGQTMKNKTIRSVAEGAVGALIIMSPLIIQFIIRGHV